MRVQMRFVCTELLPLENGPYEVPDGSTLLECVTHCAAGAGLTAGTDLRRLLLFLQNNRSATADTAAEDGASVIVLRRILGG